ncbi:sacsin N-terminal ATP-binding-like domain-containing protein [Oerskovia enterophila]|uniref:sacsin N-terminal ATP-binding-like domain-containing protein n=1 Tax=Oerskovia enterophila TaxID=43678 RepID=UPI003800DC1B
MTFRDEATIESFEDLAPLRRKGVDGLRANGWEGGFRDLLADLYPDNAHFIYELLQNAEDAGAREVTFDLRSDGLRVEHDGTRLFALADIVSITGIGKSTKADDATSIGKFGVGFKSVFAYTQRPVIHSGEHSFEIVDLFVPERVKSEARPGMTRFWFPFDRPDKPAERAVAEVASALRDVARSTLLFLNTIKGIACYFPDGDERLLERRDVDDHVVAIESAHEDDGPNYWYRITGDVAIDDKTFQIAAAFALEKRSDASSSSGSSEPNSTGSPRKRRTPQSEFVVRPTDGQVFIYFPAVKETSGLRFHIHAPFASTVARDSVRDDKGNDRLVAGIAQLVSDAMPALCDAGLVDDGLLSALPNHKDVLEERYRVVRDRVIGAFKTNPLTPAVGGVGYRPSKTLIRSVSALRATLTPKDVDVLREISVGVDGNPSAGWLPELSGRPGAFLDSLDAIGFAGSELADVFERVNSIIGEFASWGDEADEVIDEADHSDMRTWGEWISGKDDLWLRSFYAALGRVAEQSHDPLDRFPDSLDLAPIVRVRLGGGVQHVPGDQAFLPTDPGLVTDGLVLDTLVAFGDGETKAERQDNLALRHFFSHAGTKEWNAAARLDARLATYDNPAETALEDHVNDLAELARLLDEKAVSIGTYSKRPILRAIDEEGNVAWRAPARIYLDEPYDSIGLGALYESDAFAGRVRPHRLSDEYFRWPWDIASLARTLGAKDSVEITSVTAKSNVEFVWTWDRNESHLKVNSDWTIVDFDAIVATDDESLLRALWNVVAGAPSSRAVAFYQSNASRKLHQMNSQLVQKLTTVPWVLDRYGNRALPEDMTLADLDETLAVPADAPLLSRSGFGRKAVADETARAEADDTARRLGFDSSEELERLGELRKCSPTRFAELLEQLEARLKLPEGASLAPERRAGRAAEGAAAGSPRRYEDRVRSVYVQEPGHVSAARGYLRRHYTNADGVMVCQICSTAMPFRINDEDYFEAVQFVREARRDLRENRLALCPTCAAKYRHAISTTPGDLRDDLLTQEVGTQKSISVDVSLAGTDQRIRFIGKHAIDLQASLEAIEGSALDGDEPEEP